MRERNLCLQSILLWSYISGHGSTLPMVNSTLHPNSYMECLVEFLYLCFPSCCHPPDGVIQYHEDQSADLYILGITGQVQHLQLDEGQSSNSQPDLMNIL